MQFGYFDDPAKEYVVARPDTPRPWANYLGTTEYGAIITNNAGGYSFYRSASHGRFLRLRSNAVPLDQPGRYFYLRNRDNGDFWSASWQPVGKPLEKYESVCRHGTAYTIITSKYDGIETESTYFVPLKQTFEYWRLRVTNRSSRPRRIAVFTYCEFAGVANLYNDLVNLQYSLFVNKADMVDGMLAIASHPYEEINPSNLTEPGAILDEADRRARGRVRDAARSFPGQLWLLCSPGCDGRGKAKQLSNGRRECGGSAAGGPRSGCRVKRANCWSCWDWELRNRMGTGRSPNLAIPLAASRSC